jgi:hypothetical protein
MQDSDGWNPSLTVGSRIVYELDYNLKPARLSEKLVLYEIPIWNPVHLLQDSTRWYVLPVVRLGASLHCTSTYLTSTRYRAVTVRETSKWYIPLAVHTNKGNSSSYSSTYWYVLVCTALYLHSTRWYKVVQDGTRWYKVVQTTVYEGTWRCKALRESFKS